jgi:hypothetical protein
MRARSAAIRLLVVLPLLGLISCGPKGGPDPVEPDLSGSTTDSFSMYVYRASDELPLESIRVRALFVDDDTIDPQTGRYAVRRVGECITNINGICSMTVTYNGEGRYAADKVNHELYLDDRQIHHGSIPLINHQAHASAAVNLK